MGFYLYFSVLILSIFLILNVFTAPADALQLSVSHDGDQCPGTSDQCAVILPFDKHLELTCTSDSSSKLEWFKEPTDKVGSSTKSADEGIAVKANQFIKMSSSEKKLVMNITAVQIEDEGRYFCKEISDDKSITAVKSAIVEIRVLPYVKMGKDLNVIEENKINLTCYVLSSKPAVARWNVTTLEYNTSKIFDKSEDRVELFSRNETTNAEFFIKSANLTKDRGTYVCHAYNEWGNSSTNATYIIRVKSKYAAVWPFLGMCAEVIILCTIIFIYEKKRDKTELEESDTDQGPETKCSPDHGQDSVRYRK